MFNLGNNAQAGFEWTPPPPKAEPPPIITPPPASISSDQPPSLKTVPVESIEIEPTQAKPVVGKSAPAPAKTQTLDIEELESDPKHIMKIKTVSPPPAPMPEMDLRPRVKTERVPPVNTHKTPKQKKNVSIHPFPHGTTSHEMMEASTAPAPQKRQYKIEPKTYPEVIGFGSDLPLALALRQVVPPEYSFSFGDGVNPGYRVSWNGGRPWNEVVNDMVAPLDLSARIYKKTVSISKSGQSSDEDLSMIKPQKQEPQAGGSRRINITDPGETPGKLVSNQPANSNSKVDILPAKSSTIKADENTLQVEPRQNNSVLKTWEAKQGDSLKTTLSGWSKQAGAELVWEASHDYALDSNVMVNGTFDSAVKVLFVRATNPSTSPDHEMLSKENADDKMTLVVKDRS
ncbi:MAG: hypothetical protein DHS20C02_14990 [Micavibrio sp.]|nr:MAG: hypothetical protein DHS20C02_14990 [Micavibrio sp.]